MLTCARRELEVGPIPSRYSARRTQLIPVLVIGGERAESIGSGDDPRWGHVPLPTEAYPDWEGQPASRCTIGRSYQNLRVYMYRVGRRADRVRSKPPADLRPPRLLEPYLTSS